MSYDEITASGQQFTVGDNEVLEGLLLDVSNGADVHIDADGTDWTIRNIGIKGYYDGGGVVITCRDTDPDGESTIENVYMADGASKAGTDPGAIIVGPDDTHNGHVSIRQCNVQGWPNHGFHCSGGDGTVSVENCVAANNGVANIRCAEGDRLYNCTVYNDGREYGWYHEQYDFVEEAGRPLWVHVGSGSEVDAYNCQFDAGDYPGALYTEPGADAYVYSGNVAGGHQDGVTVAAAVGDDPRHEAPAGVPTTPEQAASGTSGTGGGSDQTAPDVPDPTFHQYGVAYYSETGRAQVTDSDFIWEGDGRPLWADDGAMGYAHGRFDLNPEVDDDYATDGGDDPGDVEVDAEDDAPEDSTGNAPDNGGDVAEGADEYPSAVDLRITDVYVADIEEGPAIHIGADSDDATAVVENAHVDGAEVGILADGCTVEVRDCQINADERFATENGGEITEDGVGSSPSLPGSAPASVDEAARGNAYTDL